MKEIHFGLLPRILVAIVLGIGFGCFLPGVVVRGFATFNSIFSHFLQFLIPLIIIGLVTPAIAEIGKGAGVLLAITALIAYLDSNIPSTSFKVSSGCNLFFDYCKNRFLRAVFPI